MMRAILILLLAVQALLTTSPATALPDLSAAELRKLDPLLAVATPASPAAPAAATAAAPSTIGPVAAAAGVTLKEGVPVVNLLIEVRHGDTRGLAELGITTDAVIGDVAAARDVPLTRLADLARRPEVISIQAARRLVPMNDVSVPETGAPGVWSEFGATGQGVIVGIIDTGIDLAHPDFMNPNGTTRIKWLLDLSQPGNGPGQGTLFSEDDINAGAPIAGALARDRVGHGTHVAGTAAGGGRGDIAFRGVAYEADLIIVNASRGGNGSFVESDIVGSLGFIDDQAEALGKPYIANLSLGGHGGAHDGSGLLERAIDFLVGAGKPGKAVVIAAGNERAGPPGHGTGEVTAGHLPAGLELRFNVPNYQPQSGVANDFAVINVWYEVSSLFTFTVETPHGISVGPFAPGQSNGENGTLTADGLIAVENAITGSNPQNGDHVATFILIDFPTTPAEGVWTIRIAGDTGAFDAYLATTTLGDVEFLTPYGTTLGFVAEPGTSRNAITVGAYVTKNQWTDTDGDAHSFASPIGPAAFFSNAGPTRDGRYKPELCAPGAVIASSFSIDAHPAQSNVSSFISPVPGSPNFFILEGEQYAIQAGTSQATPHVTGATALLFDLHPDWDIFDVKRALTTSARGDGDTGPLPNFLFGHGKLDILEAARGADADTLPPGDVDGNGTTELADAVLAIDFVLNGASPSDGQPELRADMNADGLLEIGDLVLIVREVTGTSAHSNPPPAEASDAEVWRLPVAFAAGRPVVGAEFVIAFDPTRFEPLPDAVGTTRDGAVAIAAPRNRESASLRVVTLSLDGKDLAGSRPVVQIPFRDRTASRGASEPGPYLVSARLIGPGAEPVSGKAMLGALERVLPASFRLLPVAPNPSAAMPGRIAFDLPGPAAQRVTVGIYDVTGRLVTRLAQGIRDPGRHVIDWDGLGPNGRRLPAGVYWVRVTAGNETATARLTLVR